MGQTTHVIRMEADTEQEIHRFVPARVTARAGDILLFRVTSGAPHNVTFEANGLSLATRQLLAGALPQRTSELSGPVLPANGLEYRIVVPAVPAGRYPFYSTPHRAYEMRGELIVVP
ncbi:MAG TPA: plastocyanin/azurin family copper-binding protein [Gemmatimonadales bacterium]|nr:plastocyanin/azurin family copper-binding protein [Gemmatimonadales bacterium]